MHGYSMSLAIMAWHVASSIDHSAYCMLRSIDSVCVNVNLRALFPNSWSCRPGPSTDVTQDTARSHTFGSHRVREARDTPRHRPLAAGGGARGARAGASTFDISRGAQARSR